MYLVIVEWDGQKPPTTFYNRLHSIGLGVRGDKSLAPISRRKRDAGGLIAQEGTFLCESESLAKYIVKLAYKYGASSVFIGNVSIDHVWSLTKEDEEIVAEMEKKLGRRGRPSELKFNVVVTCLEEAISYQARNDDSDLISCKYCKGIRLSTRVGDINVFSLTRKDLDYMTAWKNSRFASGVFEVPEISADAPPPPENVEIIDSADEEVVGQLSNLAESISSLPIETAMAVLDAAFVSRRHLPHLISKSRVMSLFYIAERGIKDLPPLLSGQTADVLDAGPILSPNTAALLYAAVKR